MAEQKSQQNVSGFEDWLFRNGIRIAPSLKEKLSNNHLDSIDVLKELKLMNGVTEAAKLLNLNIIEKSVFNTIIRKIEVPTSGCDQSVSSQSVSITPTLINITDNKDGTVNVKLKLVQSLLNNDGKNKLRLEWAEDEKALDMGCKNGVFLESHNMELGTVQEINNIPAKINADAFKLVWTNSGNIKPLKLRCEQWDVNHKGGVISASDNIISCTGSSDCWRSIYGKATCKQTFQYHWKFRVKTYAQYFMFGIEKVANNYGLEGTHVGTKGAAFYSYGDVTYFYPTQDGKYFSGDYGSERMNKNGGELDMYLDLKKYELRFETNGVDVGYKISDLSQENYRMVTSVYTPGVRIELLQFDCNE